MGKYITSQPAINSSRSAFVIAEQTVAGGGGTDVGEDGNSLEVKRESEDVNLLICSSRKRMTSTHAVRLDLQPISFFPIHKKKSLNKSKCDIRRTKKTLSHKIPHLQVPVHDVMLVDVTDALQDLIDAVA